VLAGAAGVAGAVAGTSLLTACSGGNDNGSSGGGDTGGPVSGELEIQYFIGGYGDAWWNQVFADFETANPEVKIVKHGGSTIHQEMKSRWISNDPPDLVEIEGAGISESQMVADGQLLDLTEWLPTVKLDDGSALQDRFIAPANTYENAVYSVPLIYDNRGTWFDQSWFTQQGWDVPTDLDSWQSSMSRIKQEAGIAPMATTGVYPTVFLTGVLYPAFAGVGGAQLLNALIDGDEGAWTDPAVHEIATTVQEWVKAGFIDPGFASLTHTQAQMNFLRHQNAYVPTGFWLPNEMKADVPADFEFGVIPTPFNEPGAKMTVVPEVKTIAVAEKAKNPDAAKAFIKFIMSEKYAADFARLSGGMLNIKGIDFATSKDVPAYLQSANALLSDAEKVQLEYMAHPMHADLSTPVGNALVSLLLGSTDAAGFVEAADKAAAAYRANR